MMTSQQATDRLVAALRADPRSLLVVTGAGISSASGIATFRGSEPQAVWRSSDVETATAAFFAAKPVAQWQWYLDRFDALDSARPNPAHVALRQLESWREKSGREYLLVTQNIDCLHEAAGSRRMIKVHGTSDRLRCSAAGCEHAAPRGSVERDAAAIDRFRRRPGLDTLPRCGACGALLRAHVLFFDEYYTEHVDYRFGEVEAAAQRANLVIFIGTSFSVGVTDMILHSAALHGATQFSIDPGEAGPPLGTVEPLRLPAEEVLPAVCRELGLNAPS